MSLPLPSTSSAYRSKSRHGSNQSFGSNSWGSSLLSNHGSSGGSLMRNGLGFGEILRTRARLTNLAVYLLSIGFALSVFLNLRWILFDDRISAGSIFRAVNMGGIERPESIEKTIERTGEMQSLKHLVLVAGHAIWTGTDPDLRDDDDQWVLTPIQKGGSVKTFYKHIAKGAEIARADPQSLLLFSGSSTRPTSPLSESSSYLSLALASALLPSPPEFMRVGTEEYALDSFQNLLFGLARFWELVGAWPEKVTVIGYGMKQARFEELHRATIKYPAERFHYVGIDDEGDTRDNHEGEYKHGYLPFTTDPSGCRPPLSTKKLTRNPFSRYHPYHISVPELRDLLEWCPDYGDKVAYPGKLPWESLGEGGKSEPGRWGREDS